MLAKYCFLATGKSNREIFTAFTTTKKRVAIATRFSFINYARFIASQSVLL